MPPNAFDTHMHFVTSGWACEHRMLSEGRRQIVSLLLPDEQFGLRIGDEVRLMTGLAALNNCQVASIPRHEVLEVLDERPELAVTLWHASLRHNLIKSEWLTNIGRRGALERLAHLFCELITRRSGSTQDIASGECELPLSQTDLADIVGLSVVHVNRVLQTLRRRQAITVKRGRLMVADFGSLKRLAGFDASYLPIG